MNNRLKICVQRIAPATIAFAAIPILLYLPALYYSLESLYTPFAIVDDYSQWNFSLIFNHLHVWVSEEFFGFDWGDLRYRPYIEFYHAVAWKVFGPVHWLHQLAQWAMNFGAVAAFAAAFLCFARRDQEGIGDSAAPSRLIRLLPLTALVYLWLFFPNQSAAQVGTHGIHSVLFLGISVWMTALMLSRQGKTQSRRSEALIYGAFCVSFCGFIWSKEPNIAAALWLLISYYALLAIEAMRRQSGPRISVGRALKGISAWKALGGLPLIAVFLLTLVKLYVISRLASQEGAYGATQVTPELLISNAAWIAEGLFQIHTSLISASGLALLSAVPLLFVAVNIAKRRFSDELVFTLFLLGIFASLYLILCASPYQALRYWYVLIPIFTTLLAFSIKFILEFAARFNFALAFAQPRNIAAYALTAFIAFFVCCNYYNFLYQTTVQNVSHHNEANHIAEITRLLDQKQYVYLDLGFDRKWPLIAFFHEFLPRFYGVEYVLHDEPPQEAEQTYYIVRHFDTVNHLPEIEENYRPLTYAYQVADFLQTGEPYETRDAGSGITLWQIYDNEFNRIWWNGDALNVRRLVSEAGNPIIRSDFDVYLNDRWLIYINERCDAVDIDNTFFLGVFPIDNADLSPAQRPHGFENFGFDFADNGFGGDESCFAIQKLPEYPINRIHTGQYIVTDDGFHHTWEAEAVLSTRRIGDASEIHRLLAGAGEPIIRSDFDVYLNDRWLIYINEQCSAANLDNTFFLGVFPIDNADLSEARRPHGFDNLDFGFADYGFSNGESCFASRYLPEYPINRIHTGQYIVTEDGFHNTWDEEAVLSDE